jgi:predicted O-linked N-acetylglucosamine transferase (SPINDLY family)
VEVFAYSDVVRSDEVTERLRNLVAHWYDTAGVSDAALGEMIRQHQIDILVDLAGHTSGNRLLVFARKPAPVQVTCIGYGYTTGLSAMDYFLGNASLVPDGAEAFFSEQVFRLWHPPFCYRPPENMPPASPLPARANGCITFACFSRPTRVNRRVIAVWAQILTAIPRARLVLNHQPFVDGSTRELFLAHFAAHGVDPQRIVLDYSSPWQALNGIDIALDPFPHNAGTTTLEALWMGVPVISLVDRPPLGRIGAMILRSLQLPEWLAEGEAEYVRIAVEASHDLDRLAHLRRSLRNRMRDSPLLDEAGFARELEAAYRTMWREWCERSPRRAV